MHTSVLDPGSVVKRGGRRRPRRPSIPDKTIFDVAAFVRARWRSLGVPADPEDVFQDAAETALATRRRYGHKIKGNPFTYICGPAFRETKLRSLRELAVVSLSEKKALLAVELQDRMQPDRRAPAEELEPPFHLRGELERRQKVARLIGRLELRERRLIAIAVAEPDVRLRGLALRTKMGRKAAAKVLRSLVRAVGEDPAFDHLRRVISRA